MVACAQSCCCFCHSFVQFLPVSGHILCSRPSSFAESTLFKNAFVVASTPLRGSTGARPPSRSIFSNRHPSPNISSAVSLPERLPPLLLRWRESFAAGDVVCNASDSFREGPGLPAKLTDFVRRILLFARTLAGSWLEGGCVLPALAVDAALTADAAETEGLRSTFGACLRSANCYTRAHSSTGRPASSGKLTHWTGISGSSKRKHRARAPSSRARAAGPLRLGPGST